MITNERQYKITRKKADNFARAIEMFDDSSDKRADIHPKLQRAEKDAMESQLSSLLEELGDYERLKSADLSVISMTSFEELAEGLIKARIAAGLSQRSLAERLNLKEQQIQRYEAERFASASFRRLCQVADALGVRIENDILLPVVPASFEGLLSKVSQVGLNREFVVDRLLSSQDAAIAEGEVEEEAYDERLTARTATVLERVYGWTRSNIFGAQALSAPYLAAASARFKVPKRSLDGVAGLLATYASYLALVTIRGMADCPTESIPVDPREMRRRILARGKGKDDFRTVLHTVWDLGVVVLPLRGKGTFHGACWRYEGRNVIVLKQTSQHEAHWTFDLLHELFHASQRPLEKSFELVEVDPTSSERRESGEEIAASQYAGDVMLDGKAEELAKNCVAYSRNTMPKLKNAVRRVANENGVNVGALANYVAFRLSWQGLNWWGASANLQRDSSDPWTIARDVFVERHPFQIEDEVDRALLDRALN